MPSFSVVDYPEKVKECFGFLVSKYKFKLVKCRWSGMDHTTIYKAKTISIEMRYDIRDNTFYFYIVGEHNKKKMFHDFFIKYEEIPFKKVIPDSKQYIKSLKLNAELLEKYGSEVLGGKEWI